MGNCVSKRRNTVHPVHMPSEVREAAQTEALRDDATSERREEVGDTPRPFPDINPSIPESFYPEVIRISCEEEQCRLTRRNIAVKEAERPLRCLVEEVLNGWCEGSVLSLIESHALSVPAECTTSVESLASSLAHPQAKYYQTLCYSGSFQLQIAKAYAIYFWIANNIDFCRSMWERFLSHPEDLGSKTKPQQVLQRRKCFSIGHANLFHSVATAAGLTARVVVGNLKLCRSLSPQDYRQKFETSRVNIHWWNMFLIDDVWFPVDCVCGAGMVAPHLSFHRKFTPYYFAVRPDNLILSHIPVEPEWQHLQKVVTLQNLSPMISPSLPSFYLGIQPLSWAETVNTDPESNTTTFKISLEAKFSIQLTAQLRRVGTVHYLDQALLPKDDQLQATHIDKKVSNIVDVYATAPGKGEYFLDIHARQNGESLMCLSYMFKCTTNPTTCTGFPTVYPLASAAFEFKLLYWNTPQAANICENHIGKMNLVFRCLPGTQFLPLSIRDVCGLQDNPEIGAHYYSTAIINDPNDKSLRKLSVIFPNKGWWTVYLCAAKMSGDVEVSGYTTLLNYRVFAKNGLSGCSYPHVKSSDVRFEYSEPISCSGTDVLTVPFFSKKKLGLYSYLCHETLEGKQASQYTLTQSLEDVMTPNEYKYALCVIFPKPGKWYVRVFSRDLTQTLGTEFLSLFDLCIDVNGCMHNAVFPILRPAVTEKCNITLLPSNSLVTFNDKEDMFSFMFQAPMNINFDHYIELGDGTDSNESVLHRYCTFLRACQENGTQSIYELRAVFPVKGVWSVVICAGDSFLSKPKEAIRISLNISNTSNSLVFPAIYPPLYEFGVQFTKDYPLYPKCTDSPEFKFEFLSPKSIEYAWSLKDIQTQTQFQHSTNVYLDTKGKGDILMQKLCVVFPKPGMWLLQVVARIILTNVVADNSLSLSLHYQPVFDLIIDASNASLSHMAFPRVYEPFHSTFGLGIENTDVPIPSRFIQLPATCTIKFYSPAGVVFWHNCKEFSQMKDKKITRMTSNPETGLHELYVDIGRRGHWTVYLYAKFANDTSNNWTAVLQHTITARPPKTSASSSLSSY